MAQDIRLQALIDAWDAKLEAEELPDVTSQQLRDAAKKFRDLAKRIDMLEKARKEAAEAAELRQTLQVDVLVAQPSLDEWKEYTSLWAYWEKPEHQSGVILVTLPSDTYTTTISEKEKIGADEGYKYRLWKSRSTIPFDIEQGRDIYISTESILAAEKDEYELEKMMTDFEKTIGDRTASHPFDSPWFLVHITVDRSIDRKEWGLPEECPIPPAGPPQPSDFTEMPSWKGIKCPEVFASEGFGTIFQIHEDDFQLCVININYAGAPKLWITIPATELLKLDDAVRKSLNNRSDGVEPYEEQSVRHQNLWIPRKFLEKHQIRFSQFLQYPGQVVIVMPGVYHQGFNCGANIAESVNYHSTDWKFPEIDSSSDPSSSVADPLATPRPTNNPPSPAMLQATVEDADDDSDAQGASIKQSLLGCSLPARIGRVARIDKSNDEAQDVDMGDAASTPRLTDDEEASNGGFQTPRSLSPHTPPSEPPQPLSNKANNRLNTPIPSQSSHTPEKRTAEIPPKQAPPKRQKSSPMEWMTTWADHWNPPEQEVRWDVVGCFQDACVDVDEATANTLTHIATAIGSPVAFSQLQKILHFWRLEKNIPDYKAPEDADVPANIREDESGAEDIFTDLVATAHCLQRRRRESEAGALESRIWRVQFARMFDGRLMPHYKTKGVPAQQASRKAWDVIHAKYPAVNIRELADDLARGRKWQQLCNHFSPIGKATKYGMLALYPVGGLVFSPIEHNYQMSNSRLERLTKDEFSLLLELLDGKGRFLWEASEKLDRYVRARQEQRFSLHETPLLVIEDLVESPSLDISDCAPEWLDLLRVKDSSAVES